MSHILTFNPIYKERIWGGRNLDMLFGKGLPEEVKVGESWELSDLPEDKSVVNIGPSVGKTLSELVELWGKNLLGDAKLENGQFPLLVKFLDANDVLSVQVHPDYESAREIGGGVQAKFECWYILDAQEDSFIYRGVKPGTTNDDIAQAINNGTLEELLVKLPARKGDFFYLPGGTVHAMGKGLVAAEVQTPSDTTFRLYDWNRVDAKTGKPRELHIENGLASIRFHEPSVYEPPSGSGLLAEAPTFTIRKREVNTQETISVDSDSTLVWIIISGNVSLSDNIVETNLCNGQLALIPPGASNVRAKFDSSCRYLEVTLT